MKLHYKNRCSPNNTNVISYGRLSKNQLLNEEKKEKLIKDENIKFGEYFVNANYIENKSNAFFLFNLNSIASTAFAVSKVIF